MKSKVFTFIMIVFFKFSIWFVIVTYRCLLLQNEKNYMHSLGDLCCILCIRFHKSLLQLYGTTKMYFWNADTPWGGFMTIYVSFTSHIINVVLCFDHIILIHQDFLFTIVATPHQVMVKTWMVFYYNVSLIHTNCVVYCSNS